MQDEQIIADSTLTIRLPKDRPSSWSETVTIHSTASPLDSGQVIVDSLNGYQTTVYQEINTYRKCPKCGGRFDNTVMYTSNPPKQRCIDCGYFITIGESIILERGEF